VGNWDISNENVLKGKRKRGLPNNWLAQTCELFALNQALKLLKDKEGTIYTDSKYVFGVVHTCGKIWVERGLINSRGQDLIHKELIIKLLESLTLPEETAMVHIPRHQWGNSPEAQGNNLADMAELPPIWNSNVTSHPHYPGTIHETRFHSLEEGPTREAGCFPNPRREMASSRWERSTF
jgi:hypothetical protein